MSADRPTPEDYHRVKELFLACREVEPDHREAYLDEHCSDSVTRDRVRELLHSADQPGDELELGAVPALRAAMGKEDSVWGGASELPKRIGEFRIRGVLGEGSMGIVYEAEQEHPKRQVALKVLRPGLMASELSQRFEREVQALGRLQHPGIAQMYQAGTTDTAHGAMPFFAMELVRGENLTATACRDQLDQRARVELLVELCDAVEHAHRQGILHRDLKPENILVDDRGSVRVLDFGIARNLDGEAVAESLQTRSGQLLGTLAYMSPEQVAGNSEEIDARADVYALGAVGFELLSGEMPFQMEGLALPQAVRLVGEGVPRNLADLEPATRGDLATVIHKALAHDRADRYATAADLAADLRRFLDRRPVRARPPSLIYQWRKYAERNRAVSVAVMVAGASVLIGAAVSIVLALQAMHDRDRARAAAELAERRLEDLEQETRKLTGVNQFLEDMLGEVDPLELRSGIQSIRDVRVYDLLEEAARGLEQAYQDQPSVEASLRMTLGKTLLSLRAFEASREQYQRAVDLLAELAGKDHRDRYREARTHLGSTMVHGGDPLAGEALLDALLREERQLRSPDYEQVVLLGHQLVAALLLQNRDEVALVKAREVCAVADAHLRPDNPESLSALHNLAFVLRDMGSIHEARDLFADLLDRRLRKYGPGHPLVTRSRIELSIAFHALGDFVQAGEQGRAAYEACRALYGDEHPIALASLHVLVSALIPLREHDEADRLLFQGMDALERAGKEQSSEMNSMRYQLARSLALQGRFGEALELDQQILDWRLENFGERHVQTLTARLAIAQVTLASGDHESAESLYFEALLLAEELPEFHPERRGYVRREYAQCLRRLSRDGEAEEQLLEALEDMEQAEGPGSTEKGVVLRDLVTLYRELGDSDALHEYSVRLRDFEESLGQN